MNEPRMIKIACTGAAMVDLNELTEFQGELKSLHKDDYERLRAEIKDQGFSFPISIWRNSGKNYILDGHQRLRTVKRMIEMEGFAMPSVPVNFVEADSVQQAKHKLLAATSQYGKMERQGLYEFVTEAGMPLEELMGSFRFPEIDLPNFAEEFFESATQPQEPPPEQQTDAQAAESTPSAVPGSTPATSQVRMVQLFFNEQTLGEFMELVKTAMQKHGKENITDTVLEVMRASCKSNDSSQ